MDNIVTPPSPLPLFTEVLVTSQERERSCIFVLGVLILSFSKNFQLDFRTFPTWWNCLFFISLVNCFSFH